MSDNSKIEWTDATWNPITGCSVISAGCKHCYAMKLAGTRMRHHPSRAGLTVDTKAGPVWTGEVRFNPQWLDQPLHWKRPRRIFVCAHSDLFHESVPDEWIDRVFEVMALTPWHTYQLVTKRPQRAYHYLERAEMEIRDRIKYEPLAASMRWPLPNVWLLVSVEDQESFDERIPWLLSAQAAVRGLSCEPLLGPLFVFGSDGPIVVREGLESPLHWVIVGGESGASARPMHPAWVRDLREQCASAGVPFFFKQWGEHHPSDEHDLEQFGCEATPVAVHVDGRREWRPFQAFGLLGKHGWKGMCEVGKKGAGRLLDGVEHNEFPRAQA